MVAATNFNYIAFYHILRNYNLSMLCLSDQKLCKLNDYRISIGYSKLLFANLAPIILG